MKKIAVFAIACAGFSAGAQQMDAYERQRGDERRDYDRGNDRGDDIQLVCFGMAEQPTAETRNGYQWNPNTHKYEPKSEVVTGRRDFDTSVNISIHDDRGRIRMPQRLIPPLNSGGSDGWWDIDDLMVGHNEIRGRFRLNGMNRPTLVIDRRSGSIAVDGLIKFNGRCEADSGHRRF